MDEAHDIGGRPGLKPMEVTMHIIHKIAPLVATCAFAAASLAGEAHATAGDCAAVAQVTVRGQVVELPLDVAQQVVMLQGYGTRYARLIDLVLEENAKPDWTVAADCADTSVDLIAASD